MSIRAKILNASAGSGKTYQLAYKYVRDTVERPDRYRSILAVTFTNKATEEMKSRILREIHLLASDRPSAYLSALCRELRLDAATVRKRAGEVRTRILHDYSRFTVLTIDTFFQRILRAFIKELGIDLDYNIEIETASVLARSADTLIDRIAEDRELRQWLTQFAQERIDEGRRWDIREGILALGGELFKERNKEALASSPSREELRRIVGEALAEAEASTRRLVELGAQGRRIIEEAGLTWSDFAGKSRSFARYFYDLADENVHPYSATVAQRAASPEGWCSAGSPALRLVPQLQPLLRQICDLYNADTRNRNTCALLRANYRGFALLADLYAQVQQLCDTQHMMLLSETKYLLAEFIRNNDAPFIYEKVGNRFERFMIDEFQDTSVKEWENFLPLLRNAMAQAADVAVLLVGDIKQSIYRWRGGDWQILHAGAREALGAGQTRVTHLRRNFRSLPCVVHFNNRIIHALVADDNRQLNTTLDEAAARHALDEAARAELHDMLGNAYLNHIQRARPAASEGYVCVETCEGEPPVVERICALLDRGFRPCDLLILVRSMTDGQRIAETLLDFKSRNSEPRYRFDVMTQEALVIGRAPVCAFVTAVFRLAVNDGETLHRALYNRYLGHPFDAPLTDDDRTFLHAIRLLSPEEAFEHIVLRYKLHEGQRQLAYLHALHEQVLAFSTSKIADIALFLRWWDEQGSSRSLSVEPGETAIEITTIHKAKGLERRAVLIPFCTWPLNPHASNAYINNVVWAEAHGGADAGDATAEAVRKLGRFPVSYSKTMAASAYSADYYRELVYAHVDNVNLLYVALTRAAESLHIFIPAKRGSHIGTQLRRCIEVEGGTARIGKFRGRYTALDTGERFEFGTFAGPAATRPASQTPVAHIRLEEYPTAVARPRMRLPSQRYFEEEPASLSPRNFGILMHKAFEAAATEEDIRSAIVRMEADGTLTAAEAAALGRKIEQALTHPVVRSWFDGSWRQVRNEHEIIVPRPSSPTGRPGTSEEHAIRRPDRVMLREEEAMVVDYKFGQPRPEHARQVGDYLALLRRMGYARVTGYLWYVQSGRVEPVAG